MLASQVDDGFREIILEEILKVAKSSKSFHPKLICASAMGRKRLRINNPGSSYRLPAITFKYLNLIGGPHTKEWLKVSRMSEYADTVYWDDAGPDRTSLDCWLKRKHVDYAYSVYTGKEGPFTQKQVSGMRSARTHFRHTVRYMDRHAPAIDLWKRCKEELGLDELVAWKAPNIKRKKENPFSTQNTVPLSWPGSKRRIAEMVFDKLDLSSGRFTEVCAGSGVMSMYVRTICPDVKVWLNDADKTVWAFHTTVRDDPDHLIRQVVYDRPTPAKWKEYKAQLAKTGGIPAKELAWMFYFVMVYSFGQLGEVYSPVFHCKDKLKINKFVKCSELLQGVQITNGDYSDVIRKAEGALYIDPPYLGIYDCYYGRTFTEDDHEDLAALLKAYKGPWLLSYDLHRTVRKLYSGCRFWSVPVSRSMGGASSRRTEELLITP